jgi:NADH:ubiquinone reductase (H+-translocating)
LPTGKRFNKLLTFVLVGAGTVGVEMASAMAEMMRIALAQDFRHINPASAQIILYEAAKRILPTFPEILSSKAHRHLEKLGVRIRTGTRVDSVDLEGVVVEGKHVPSRTIIWCAGVVASPAARWLSVETDRFGRVKVNPDLSIPGHANIFAIGDTAEVVAYTPEICSESGRERRALYLAWPSLPFRKGAMWQT